VISWRRRGWAKGVRGRRKGRKENCVRDWISVRNNAMHSRKLCGRWGSPGSSRPRSPRLEGGRRSQTGTRERWSVKKDEDEVRAQCPRRPQLPVRRRRDCPGQMRFRHCSEGAASSCPRGIQSMSWPCSKGSVIPFQACRRPIAIDAPGGRRMNAGYQ